MTTVNILDKDGKSISKDDISSMPSDRHFRGAWTLSGQVISEDMDEAKKIIKVRRGGKGKLPTVWIVLPKKKLN